MENMTLSKAAAITIINPFEMMQNTSYMDTEFYESKSLNTDLCALSVLQGSLTPTFSPNITEYTLEVDCCISKITIIPAATDKNAVILVNNEPLLAGKISMDISLETGQNDITIEVSDSNQEQKNLYIISAVRKPNLHLAQLDLNYAGEGYMMNSAFTLSHSDAAYLRCIPQKASNVRITPIAEDMNVIINIGGQILKNKEKSAEIELSETYSEIVITVTNPEFDIHRDYILSIIKNFA
jgi:hypothetical protein